MLWLKFKEFDDITLHAINSLSRKSVNQIKIQIVKTLFPDQPHGLFYILKNMTSADGLKQLVVSCLNPHADPINAKFPVIHQFLSTYRFRIHFYGKLFNCRNIK